MPGEQPIGTQPWKAAGISKATYYRRRVAERETGAGIPSDPIWPLTLAFLNSYQVGENPASSLNRIPPTPGQLPTAEARRLAVVAARLGFQWSLYPTEDPATWFIEPTERKLSPSDVAEFEKFIGLAEDARIRAEAIANARARDADRAMPKVQRQKPLPRDPQSRPTRVDSAIWDVIPPHLREYVVKHAGRLVLNHVEINEAIANSVEPAARKFVLDKQLRDAVPDITELELGHAVRQWWQQPTAEGLKAAVDELWQDRHKAQNPTSPLRLRVIAEVDDVFPPIPDEYRQQVVDEAVRHLEIRLDRNAYNAVARVWGELEKKFAQR